MTLNKAQLKLDLNELITIDNTVYHVAEHPALPGVPYIQRGARGFVIQLKSPGPERYALKYFKLKYRVPDLITIGRALKQYAELPGLRAAYRTVFTYQTHATLIQKYPALEYGVLMPWLPGTTWFDMLTRKRPLAPLASVKLAQQMARVLAGLESRGLAHCDIAGANVMIEQNLHRVELVDIEEMYGSSLPRPVEFPAGQEGYQHKASAVKGQWGADGDRFGGAVIIAEMLGWYDARLRENSADEHYFAAAEMQQADSPRYKLLNGVLHAEYSAEIADLFEMAWRSASLADCPPLSAWVTALERLETVRLAPAPRSSEVVTGRRQLIVTPPGNAAPPMVVTTPAPVTPALQPVPAATKLCPQCGAANLPGADYCVKCHYYLKGNQRPPQAPAAASNRVNPPGQIGYNPASVAPPSALNPNARMAAQNVTNEVIRARNPVGSSVPGSSPTPPEATPDGRWLVIAVVVGFILMLVVFASLIH